jgi:hypothetical protein
VVPFLYCVRQPRPPFKKFAVAKNRNFFSYQFLLYYTSKWNQILTAATWQWVVYHTLWVFLWDFFSQFIPFRNIRRKKITSKSVAQKFELKWSFGGPLSKLCATTPPFSINFECQIKNQVSDYRILGASSSLISKYKKILFRFEDVLRLPDSTSNISIKNLIYLRVLHKKWSDFYTPANKVWGVYRNHPVRPSVFPSIHVPCKRNSS